MARRPSQTQPQEARLSYEQMESAIIKIDRLLQKLRDFDVTKVMDGDDPSVRALETYIDTTIGDIFGYQSLQYQKYKGLAYIRASSISFGFSMPIQERRKDYERCIQNAISILQVIKEGFSQDLSDAGRGSSTKPLRAYEALDLHPEVERQVGQLFRDGHYAEAIEKSVKVLNNLVRLRSNEALDGTALMQKVFSPKEPILKFNDLNDQSDKDEQQGFMFLFSGAVMGLRNPRAHKIIQDDPELALEFIAFVSLLAKLLDSARD